MQKIKIYTKKTVEHFQKPHNWGKIKSPDGVGKVGNIVCGDVMWLYMKVGKNKQGKEIIKDAKFESFGCVAAIATSSVMTDLIKGKTIEKALEFNRNDIVKELGGLPPIKVHCSVLATEALYEAIYDYLKKKKRKIPEKLLKLHQQIEKHKKELQKRYKKWKEIEKI